MGKKLKLNSTAVGLDEFIQVPAVQQTDIYKNPSVLFEESFGLEEVEYQLAPEGLVNSRDFQGINRSFSDL